MAAKEPRATAWKASIGDDHRALEENASAQLMTYAAARLPFHDRFLQDYRKWHRA
jgi:hypothetical protein